jgi:hypothetical protein
MSTFQDLPRLVTCLVLWQLLANATTYQAWLTAAEKLDELEGVGEWKRDPTSPYYDSRLIQERLIEMKRVISQFSSAHGSHLYRR